MARIYVVKINNPEPSTRLVKAGNVNAAIRHVADTLLHAELATQETLVSLVSAGVKVEDAWTEAPKQAAQ